MFKFYTIWTLFVNIRTTVIGLRVYLYDRLISTESREDIQELVNFLLESLRLSDKPTARIQDYQQETLPLEYIPSVSVRKMSEWLQIAWEALDNPVFGATGEEIYQALINLGFQSTADDPKAAVKASIRMGKQFIRVGTNKSKEVLWALKEEYIQPSIAPPRFTLNDPRRQTTRLKTVDYAVRALKELSGIASSEELADKMVSYGWKTKSDDKPGLVAATLRKYQEFEKHDAKWVFSNHFIKDENAK